MARHTTRADDPADAPAPGLPHGLSDKTLADYQIEWARYVSFAETRNKQDVPGRDSKWDMQMLWEYMQLRSARCKPTTITQIVTKLWHFGQRHGFVLATSKFDGKPRDYGVIRNMKRQLSLLARAQAAVQGRQHANVDRCAPIGKRGVEMLLSAFGVVNEQAFLALSRRNRHHIAATMMQHTGGMRFGQFYDRDYTVDSFIQDVTDGSLRLVTDFSRYAGKRQYCINFEASPRYESMW